ncbi:MAG: OmpA family protein [Sulfuricaulis sp.]
MRHYRFLATTLLATAAFAGCSTVPENNSQLDQARTDYSAAQNNPQVVTLAPSELKQAGDTLAQANDASNKNADAAVVTHLAYMAKQQVAIAQQTAEQKAAETTVNDAAANRSQIRLDARTDEANKAQLDADASKRQAETSQQDAAVSQQQSEASQQQASEAQLNADASKQQAETSQQDAAVSQQQAAASQQQANDAQVQTSQLETQLKELNAKQTERGLVITLGDLLFDTNKAELKSGGTRSLKKLAGFLKQYPQRTAQVEGYTDNRGNAEHNQELSDRRANAVRASLMDMGVSSDRITSHGNGDASPVASNDTAAGRQMNRRVEIILPNDNGNVSSR